MTVFLTLLLKIIPLNFIIGVGFVAARFLGAQKETVSKLLLYVVSPAVIFYGITQTQLNPSLLALPILFFLACSFLALLFLSVGKLIWPSGDNTRNLLGFTAGSGNTGYFGLPVGLILFGQQAFGPIVLCILGYILYEFTVGFFIMARGNYTLKESLMKICKLPAIYAFILGIVFKIYDIPTGEFFTATMESFKGAYTILGMIIIGMGLSTVSISSFDLKLLSTSFFAKFVAWPLLMAGIILADKTFLHLYDASIYKVLFLMSIVPLAANTVTFATELKLHAEKASLAVLFSTLFAVIYIPLMTALFL